MAQIESKVADFREEGLHCELDFNLRIPELDEFLLAGYRIKAVRQQLETVSALKQHLQNKIDKVRSDNGLIIPSDKDLVHFYRNDLPLKDSTTLKDLFQRRQDTLTMKIYEQKFYVKFNAPLIKEIVLPPVIYANCPLQPVKFRSVFTVINNSKFIWFKSLDKEDWVKFAEGYNCKVTNEEIGHYIQLVCIPMSHTRLKGTVVNVIAENVVQTILSFPKCPFNERHVYTSSHLNHPSFRVVSYNILSEKYSDNDKFPYCSLHTLSADYRKQLIIKELVGYNADIICLQEVDTRHFVTYYKKELERVGLIGHYYKKGHVASEGLACLFNKKRYKEIESFQIVLSKFVADKLKAFAYVHELLLDKDVHELFMKQQTSLQVTVLKPNGTNSRIIVANTHLYYHPEAGHIRLLQINIITNYLKSFRKKYIKEGLESMVILCGDLNSTPDTSTYEYLVSGKIDANHRDCLKLSENGNAILYHDLKLQSACGTPKYTNYTGDFKGCLDYIFVDVANIAVERAVPLYEDEQLEHFEGIPNDIFPSDHLALVADLRLL